MSSVNVSVNLWLIVFIKCMYIFNSVSWNVLEARNIPKAQTDISKSSSIIKYPKAPCTMGPTENLEQGRSKVSIEYPSISDIMESIKERDASFTPLCRLPFFCHSQLLEAPPCTQLYSFGIPSLRGDPVCSRVSILWGPTT